jgi:hypothetical protein
MHVISKPFIFEISNPSMMMPSEFSIIMLPPVPFDRITGLHPRFSVPSSLKNLSIMIFSQKSVLFRMMVSPDVDASIADWMLE